MRIIIIGAGPCGLGAAHRLAEQGFTDFAVYDRNPYVGGLATTFRDDRGFLWDFAVHVAHSHYTYFDRLMDSLLPEGFFLHERRSWVREYGRFIPYPFQYNLRHLPVGAMWDCVQGLIASRAGDDPRNFEDWTIRAFGEGITKHFMGPYNRKVWCSELSEMNYQWTGDRVPTIDIKRVLRNIILRKDDVSWGPNALFQFPKQGGTGAIWNALAARLPKDRVRLSCELVSVDPERRMVKFSDGTTDRYDHLISTMPITRLTALCGLGDLEKKARGLRATRVYVVGVAAPFPMPEQLRDKTWIYCPEDGCAFYRITPFSLFSPAHVPDTTRFCSFLCEISTPTDRHIAPDPLIASTLDSLRSTGLVNIDAGTAHIHRMETDHGYPVPTLERDAILREILPALESRHIYSRGRFGGWKYEVSNMDHSVMQGVEAADRILSGKAEVTLFSPSTVNAGKH